MKTADSNAVYAILRLFRHDSPRRLHDLGERRPMVLKLVHSWNAATGAEPLARRAQPSAPQVTAALDEEDDHNLDYDDPVAILIRERKADKQKHQDQDLALERRHEQRQTTERHEEEEDARRQRAWLTFEQYRREMAAFSASMDDAQLSVSRARERAFVQQQEAQRALARAQDNALVVDGGRRVYFTGDGSRLYGEDDRQITDAAVVAEAQQRRTTQPHSTSYEDFIARRDGQTQADAKVQHLSETLNRLDDLDKRVKKGDLSPEDLAEASIEKQNIIDTLPAEAREEYQRMQAARAGTRQLVYKEADPTFTSAPELAADFRQAGATMAAQLKQGPSSPSITDRSAPAYKSAPDF